jgi:protein-tyrosine phosphatase
MPEHAPHPRSLPLTGASNFRDLGGYQGLDGRTVVWRRVFRSDHLAGLTPQDLATLAELGVRHAVDFRGEHEQLKQAYKLPEVNHVPLTIEPRVIRRVQALLEAGAPPSAAETVALMQDTYRGFVLDNAARFTAFFQLLLAHDTPLVFHCTAGKDRTGFAAALFLLALGVPRDAVMQDYLLTNTLYRRPAGLEGLAPPHVLDALWRVEESYLDAGLAEVESSFGSLPRYLQEVLGVDAAALHKLQARYLQA